MRMSLSWLDEENNYTTDQILDFVNLNLQTMTSSK